MKEPGASTRMLEGTSLPQPLGGALSFDTTDEHISASFSDPRTLRI